MDFLKYENQDQKSERNRTLNVVDVWIFNIYSSNGSLSFETLITQVDVDLWIFEIQYINPNQVRGGGRSAPRLEKPYIPLEPKVRLTSNQAVNLSLSVTVTLKKKLAFYVPRFNSDGPRKSAVSHFQIAKF